MNVIPGLDPQSRRSPVLEDVLFPPVTPTVMATAIATAIAMMMLRLMTYLACGTMGRGERRWNGFRLSCCEIG